ncbi:trans-Golgi network integral membrane protein 2 [Candoia aspera]|uniref:trans-Golgi network integral membrane protein 2 n=1 Tax=Candoia aspera TaxID=51853 RepID=UPI002FD87489
MAASLCWCLLLCQLASWGSAGPLDPGRSHGKTSGEDNPGLSNGHPQLTDSAQGASDAATNFVGHKQPATLQSNSQNSKPGSSLQDPSVDHKSDAAESEKGQEDIGKSEEAQADTSGPLSLPKSKTKEPKQIEEPSVKGQKTQPDASAQDSPSKLGPDQSEKAQKEVKKLGGSRTIISDPDSFHPQPHDKEPKQTDNLPTKDQNPQSDLSVPEKLGSSEANKDQEVIGKPKEGPPPIPKAKTEESKQMEEPSVEGQKTQSGASAQDSPSKLGPVQSEKAQEKINNVGGSRTIISDPDSFHPQPHDKEPKQTDNLPTNDQNPQSDLSVPEKLGSSEANKDQEDIDKPKEGPPSIPKGKTEEPKQMEEPSVEGQKTQSGASAQDSPSKLGPVQSEKAQEKINNLGGSRTIISDPDSFHPQPHDKESKQKDNLPTNDQNPQSDLSVHEKLGSSEANKDQEDIGKPKEGPPSIPKAKTEESKQMEEPSVEGQKTQSGASAQDSPSKLGPVQSEKAQEKIDNLEKSKPVISDSDSFQLESDDEDSKQMEDSLAKVQNPQLDLPAQDSVPQKIDPDESKQSEKERVNPEEGKQEKGLGDGKKKTEKHEEGIETPRNGSENSHFFAYLVTTAIVVAALYIAYHNKRKIIAFALEGKKAKITRRPKSSDYQRLDQKI